MSHSKVYREVALLSLFCLVLVHGIFSEGWGKTNWGMSIEEVEESTNDKVIQYTEKKGVQGYSNILQNIIKIDKYNFSVFFDFTGNGLSKVMLKILPTNKTDSYGAYLFLLNELKMKYGTPSTEPADKKTSGSQLLTVEWVTAETIVRLNYADLNMKGVFASCTVQYSSRRSSSSSSL